MNTEPRPLHPDFYITFCEVTKEQLIEAISRAAETASEAHFAVTGRGSNNRTFGYSFYEFVKFEFEELTRRNPDAFRIIRRGGWVGLCVGRFELGFYRLGRSENDNISNSFPINTCGAPRVVQLDLFQDDYDPDLTKADRFILGYMLNPDDGLCAVHIGVPKRGVESNRIDDWAHSELLWEIDRESIFTPSEESLSNERAEVEVVKEIQLQKKSDIRENKQDGSF